MLNRLEQYLLNRLETQNERHSEAPRQKYGGRRLWSAFVILALLAMTGAVMPTGLTSAAVILDPHATLPASSTQFDITGFLQSATVNNIADPHSGGTMMINGHTVIVPAETIVILPANALTWQELFTHSPAPYTGVATGMALNDSPKPLTTYEFQAVGNRVIDANGDRYIAGLVHVSQQDLNSGAGYVNYINYSTGEMLVGGVPGDTTTGARVQINDPANATSGSGGRYGRAMTPDDRFQVDQDNPTILAETGFPMCLPRTDPALAADALCPQSNRPLVNAAATDQSGITPNPIRLVADKYYTVYRMDSPANVDGAAPCLRSICADPRKQAPFEVGDYVNYAGTLIQDGGANGGQYISAHTIVASLGIYTQQGIDPAYLSVDVALIGTGGLTIFGAGEAAIRTKFEGMSTDESRQIHLYGVDINPVTGATSDRDWGTIQPDPGPPGGAVRGRWRFRPPCTVPISTQKACSPPPAGQFIPPTREVRAVIEGHQQFQAGTIIPNPFSQVPGTPGATRGVGVFAPADPGPTAANGIFWGQYHAPIGEYIFPENVPGTPVPENNFNSIQFLAFGGYQSITGVQAGVLNPWPSSAPAPVAVCDTPTINGAPYSVANGGTINLSGSVPAGVSAPSTLQWTAGTGLFGALDGTATNLNGALTGATTTTPSFNATGLAAGVYNLNFTAANVCGAQTVSTTITVLATPPPTINPVQNQNVTAGNPVTINASSSSLPAPTWAWAQTAGPVNPVGFTQAPPAPNFSATSALQFTPTVAGTYTFNVTATNANGTSPATSVNIVVTANTLTNVTLNNVYRTDKQRLVITATSTDPAVTSMTLQPYLTESGTTFDPATLGAANLTVSLIVPGSFTLTAVGAARPACNLGGAYATPCAQKPLTVKAFTAGVLSGTSAPSPLNTIRT